MHIEITYGDGTVERLPVDVEGGRVSRGGGWHPGHSVADPSRCYFQRDFFECALDEGGDREGVVFPDPADVDGETGTPDYESFTWKLIGQEADLCRSKLALWLDVFQKPYDPLGDLPEGGAPTLAEAFCMDRQCWDLWLEDPRTELNSIVERRAIVAAPTP